MPHGAGRNGPAGHPPGRRGRDRHVPGVRLHPRPRGGLGTVTRRLVVEADGGSRGNPGIAAGGAVVIDADSGTVLSALGIYVAVASSNVAEYSGMVAGLEAAFGRDATGSVLVRLDSKLVVEQMSGRWKIKHPDMQVLVRCAQSLIA